MIGGRSGGAGEESEEAAVVALRQRRRLQRLLGAHHLQAQPLGAEQQVEVPLQVLLRPPGRARVRALQELPQLNLSLQRLPSSATKAHVPQELPTPSARSYAIVIFITVSVRHSRAEVYIRLRTSDPISHFCASQDINMT